MTARRWRNLSDLAQGLVNPWTGEDVFDTSEPAKTEIVSNVRQTLPDGTVVDLIEYASGKKETRIVKGPGLPVVPDESVKASLVGPVVFAGIGMIGTWLIVKTIFKKR